MLVYVLVRVRLSTPPSHWTRWATPTALTSPPVIPWATTPAKMKGLNPVPRQKALDQFQTR